MAEPLCPYFSRCGGCTAQHIDYEIQVENKKKVIQQALGISDVKVFSGNPYGYRNRMDFIFHSGGVGLRKRSEWQHIVDIGRCVISNESLNGLLEQVRSSFKEPDAFDVRKKSGTLRYVVIRTPEGNSSISFVLNPKSARCSSVIEKIREFSKISTATNIIVAYVGPDTEESVSDEFFVVKGSPLLYETLMGKKFWFPAQGFFQNNHEMAEHMHRYVNGLLANYNTSGSHLLDLYGGVGTFGIINSGMFKSVSIIESNKGPTDSANANIKENSVANAAAKVLDASKLSQLPLGKPLYVITDPPRTGMHPKTIAALNSLSPEVIIYVSCNIQQTKKELLKFPDYSVKSAALFDFFPQTPHCEAVVEMVKKK